MDQQGTTHAHELEDARHEEQLDAEAEQRHPELEVAVERSDQRTHVQRATARRDARHGIDLDVVGQDELARGVDPVEQHDEQRDQQQVTVAQDQADAAEQARHRSAVSGRDGARAFGDGSAFWPGEEQRGAEDACREEHQPHRRQRRHRELRHLRADERAEVGPQHDHDEQALAALHVERIRGERPHLRHDHQPVDADPDVERKRDRHALMRERGEERHRHHEEDRDRAQQPRTVEMAPHPAIKRDHEHQHQRRDRHGVRAGLSREFRQHEGFAQRLHDLVRREQQEPMQEEQERGAALPGPHARDERQESFEAAEFGVVGDQAVNALSGRR